MSNVSKFIECNNQNFFENYRPLSNAGMFVCVRQRSQTSDDNNAILHHKMLNSL